MLKLHGQEYDIRAPLLHYVCCTLYCTHITYTNALTYAQFLSHTDTHTHTHTHTQEYDSLRDTIEESWDQEPEARLSTPSLREYTCSIRAD